MNITMCLSKISRIAKAIVGKINYWYVLYVAKEEAAVLLHKWHKDKGDSLIRFDYQLGNKSVVFDVGGYKGDFAFRINQLFGCRVFVFEPANLFYQDCKTRFIGNSKIKTYNYGVSDVAESAVLNLNTSGSTLFPEELPPNMESKLATEQVSLRTLPDILEELEVSMVDLMELNVEGAEFKILPHLIETGAIKKIRCLQVQFHKFFPDATLLRDQIRAKLLETHDELYCYPFVWESWVLRASRK